MPRQRQPRGRSARSGTQPSLPQDEIAGHPPAGGGMNPPALGRKQEQPLGAEPAEQRRGLYWLIRVRLAVITFLLTVQLIIWQLRPSTIDLKFFVFTIILWYTLTLFFAILLRIWPDYNTQSYLQILC